MKANFIERNLHGKNREYPDVDALLRSVREWCNSVRTDGQFDADQDDRLIILTYTHYEDGGDMDTFGIIIKDELVAHTHELLEFDDIISQLNDCNFSVESV